MRLTLFFVFILLITASPLAAQQQEPADTSLTLLRMNETPPILFRPAFVLPMTFALIVPEADPMLTLYQTFSGVPQSFNWNQPHAADLTAPLMLQLYQPPAEKAFRMTLSAAGTAGALYLAYKRLKNHGF